MRFGISKTAAEGGKEFKQREHQGGFTAPLGREHYSEVEQRLGYQFKNPDFLERAFTHRSLFSEGKRSDYERLEFLGDATLDLGVADLLLEAYPEASEGELSKMRAALVNTASLAEQSKRLELNRFIKLSRGELSSGGALRPSILADVLEAVTGAIYLDAGYDAAFKVIRALFAESIATVTPTDPKTELQEEIHKAGSEAPTYLLECMEGPEHAPTFVSVVIVDGQVVGRGKGSTKKGSQQAAASEALKLLKKEDPIDQLFYGVAATSPSNSAGEAS